MEKEQLSKEILSSNLSDDAKIELFKMMFKEIIQAAPPYPYQPQVVTTPFIKPDPSVDWIKVTCLNWDDAGWWKQQMENARADAESILHPLATWNT